MKKSKILIVGLIALLMAGALFVASCKAGDNGGCKGNGDCEYAGSVGVKSRCSDSSCAVEKLVGKVNPPATKCDC